MEKKYKRLRKNTIVVFIGSAGSRLINFFMLPFYTHYLSTEQYGVSDIINTYSLILLPLITCCIADGIFIFPKSTNFDGKKRYFTSGICFALFVFLLAFPILKGVQNLILIYSLDNTISNNLWWIYLMTMGFFFQKYTQQFTMSIDKMKIFSITGVVLTMSLAVMSLLLIPRYGLDGYLIAIIISNFSAAIYAFICSGSYRYFSIKSYDFSYVKRLLIYGIPLIPNSLMWWLVNGLNRPVIENNLGLSAVGIFAVASRFPSVITMIVNVFSNAWNLSLIEEFAKPDFNQFFNRTLKAVTMIVFVTSITIMFFSKQIISLFASSDFYEAWHYLPILVISVCLENISCLVGGVFSALKQSKYFFYSSFWGAIISVIFTLMLVKLLGLYGICIAVAVSFLFILMFRINYAWNYISGLNIGFYLSCFLLMCIYALIIIMDIGIIMNIASFIIFIMIIVIKNKNDVQKIFHILKK